MKRIFCLLITLCIPLFLLCGCEKPCEYSLDLSSKLYLTDQSEKILDHFGMTRTELDQYIKENHLLSVAISNDDTVLIKLTGEETEFSRQINSFIGLSDENRSTVADYFGKNFAQKTFVKSKNDGNNYLKLSAVTQDKTGTMAYNTTEYITVCFGKLYTLTVSANATVADPADDIFSKLTVSGPLEKQQPESPKNAILIISGIVVLSVAVLVLLFTVLRDLLKKKDVSDAK